MILQKPFRVVTVTGALAAVACGGSSGITTSDPGLDEAPLAVESGMFTASAHEGELPAELVDVLNCERFAAASYRTAMDSLGEVKPFVNVYKAESEKHISRLERLYSDRGLPLPLALQVCEPIEPLALTDLRTACADARSLEAAMIGRYADLLSSALPKDVETVLDHFRSASDKHRRAFARCAAR